MYLASNKLLGPLVFKGFYYFELFSYFDGVLTKSLGVKQYLSVESVCEGIVIFVF